MREKLRKSVYGNEATSQSRMATNIFIWWSIRVTVTWTHCSWVRCLLIRMLSSNFCNWIVESSTQFDYCTCSHWIKVLWHILSTCLTLTLNHIKSHWHFPFVFPSSVCLSPAESEWKWIWMEVGVNRGFSLCCTFSDFQARYNYCFSPLIAETANYLRCRQFFFDSGEIKTIALSHRFHSWLRKKEEELHAPRAVD